MKKNNATAPRIAPMPRLTINIRLALFTPFDFSGFIVGVAVRAGAGTPDGAGEGAGDGTGVGPNWKPTERPLARDAAVALWSKETLAKPGMLAPAAWKACVKPPPSWNASCSCDESTAVIAPRSASPPGAVVMMSGGMR